MITPKHIFNTLLLALGLSFVAGDLCGQEKNPVFLALQPGITRETFYEKGEFDMNIVPLVIEIPVSRLTDLRLTSIINYHFGDVNGISDLGFQVIAPIFFQKKENTRTPSHGIYVGPLLGAGRNLLNEHYTITPGVEPGYFFKTSKRFSLTLGLQLGGSYFIYDSQPDVWRSHLGFKINLGFWMIKISNTNSNIS